MSNLLRKQSAASMCFHLTGGAEYDAHSLEVYSGRNILALVIRDTGSQVNLFFETADQMAQLRDTLTSFLDRA